MGCSNGCGTSSGSGCDSGSCGKKSTFDWLADMAYPQGFDAVEVKFKGGRKEFFRNVNNLYLATGDPIIVDPGSGHHVGFVSAQGEIVRLQMKKMKVTYSKELPIIYREATQRDLEKFELSKNRELPTMFRSRELIHELKLNMKLSDIEYQADNTKATFFYSAEDRVDFRELIKVLASEFKIRVEMRQISLREEAGRLGGIGSCGRELCCSTWMNEFKSVGTSAARYQNLSLNQSKLSGQCGRLKCCLNFELDTYIKEIKHIPDIKKIETKNGLAYLSKTDIFKRRMWFSYADDTNWYEVSVKRVKEIIEMNKNGEKPFSLEDNNEAVKQTTAELNSDILQMDSLLREKSGNKGNGRNKKRRPQDNKGKKGPQKTVVAKQNQEVSTQKNRPKPTKKLKPIGKQGKSSDGTQDNSPKTSGNKPKHKPRKNVTKSTENKENNSPKTKLKETSTPDKKQTEGTASKPKRVIKKRKNVTDPNQD